MEHLKIKYQKLEDELNFLLNCQEDYKRTLKEWTSSYKTAKGEQRRNCVKFAHDLRKGIKDNKEGVKILKRKMRAMRHYMRKKEEKSPKFTKSEGDVSEFTESDQEE